MLLYIHYGSVRDTAEETTTALVERVFALMDEHGAERFVLDIRQNTGGNGWLNQPLVHVLIRQERINTWGKLFVLSGSDGAGG